MMSSDQDVLAFFVKWEEEEMWRLSVGRSSSSLHVKIDDIINGIRPKQQSQSGPNWTVRSSVAKVQLPDKQ